MLVSERFHPRLLRDSPRIFITRLQIRCSWPCSATRSSRSCRSARSDFVEHAERARVLVLRELDHARQRGPALRRSGGPPGCAGRRRCAGARRGRGCSRSSSRPTIGLLSICSRRPSARWDIGPSASITISTDACFVRIPCAAIARSKRSVGVLGDEREQVARPVRQGRRQPLGDGVGGQHGHRPYRLETVLTRDGLSRQTTMRAAVPAPRQVIAMLADVVRHPVADRGRAAPDPARAARRSTARPARGRRSGARSTSPSASARCSRSPAWCRTRRSGSASAPPRCRSPRRCSAATSSARWSARSPPRATRSPPRSPSPPGSSTAAPPRALVALARDGRLRPRGRRPAPRGPAPGACCGRSVSHRLLTRSSASVLAVKRPGA